MSTAKPTVIVLSGAWHTPKSYSKLTKRLQEAGFQVEVPHFPSATNTRPPVADLKDDTMTSCKLIESLCNDGREVLVLMHSYGGVVGSNACKGLGLEDRKKQNLSGGIVQLVYLAAYALPEGFSVVDKVKEDGLMDLLPTVIEFPEDMSSSYKDPMIMVGSGGEATDEEVNEYVASLVRWNGNGLYQGSENCAWREIPSSYIVTTEDVTVPTAWQWQMIQKMRDDGTEISTFEIATAHAPALTATEEVVRIMEQIVAKR